MVLLLFQDSGKIIIWREKNKRSTAEFLLLTSGACLKRMDSSFEAKLDPTGLKARSESLTATEGRWERGTEIWI